MKPLFVCSFALLAIANISFAGEPQTKDDAARDEARKAIDKGNAQWIEAWDKADASLIAALFADDGVLLWRNGRVLKGPKQIFERQNAVMEKAGKGVKATVTTVDFWLDGDTAYETGTYSYKFHGEEKPQEGRYVTIWKRQSDGSWKITSDMGIPKT